MCLTVDTTDPGGGWENPRNLSLFSCQVASTGARSRTPPHGFGNRCAPRRHPFIGRGRVTHYRGTMQSFSEPRHLDTIWWDVYYTDGTSISESKGATYGSIVRAKLDRFLLRGKAGPIVELSVEDGRTGHNLFYRRRTALGRGSLKVVYVLGWIPQGPIFVVDMETERVGQVEYFTPGDPIFYPPTPRLFEGEKWTMPNATRIVNPAYERTDT